jgi:cytochrome c peroxidase
MIARPIPLGLLLLALGGCGKLADSLFCSSAGCDWKPGEWERIAALANPGPPPGDRSNRHWDSDDARRLGHAFYFDAGFSGVATEKNAINGQSPPARAPLGAPIGISCATCHDLTRAGVDTTSVPGHVSVGAGWTDVNALAVVNSAYRNVVFWNGRADSLWALNVVVAESPTTMNGNRLALAHRVFDLYRVDYERVFGPLDPAIGGDLARFPPSGKPKDPAFDGMNVSDQDKITRILVNWAKAIAAYEYQLIGNDSDFDRYVLEGPASNGISPAAQRGARLFVGKAACSSCHSGSQLTDELFHDIGIPQVGQAVPTLADCPKTVVPPNDPTTAACDCVSSEAVKCAPWGAYDGLRRLRNSTSGSAIRNRWRRNGDPLDPNNHWSDDESDTSRAYYVDLPLTEGLKGAWRTPSLRNVALTAPYMHDGRYATLQEVIWHYNSGGQAAGPEQVGATAPQIKPLMLTDAEQADLVAFLESLTGTPLPDELIHKPTGGGGASGAGGHGGGGGAGGSVGPLGSAGVGISGAGGTGMSAVGGSMATGSGGGGGTAPPAVRCTGMRPLSPAIADFETGASGPGSPVFFGASPGLTGKTFTAASPGVAPAQVSIAAGASSKRALLVSRPADAAPISSSDFYEFGLLFDDCVDASGFRAIQFTATNSAPGCQVDFSVISRPSVTSAEDPRGICTLASCDPPGTSISLSGTLHVPFSAGPSPFVDPTSVIGLRWRVPSSCGIAVTIDDIVFGNP